MKPRNFPAKKVTRRINANRDMSKPYTAEESAAIAEARLIRTKKNRSS